MTGPYPPGYNPAEKDDLSYPVPNAPGTSLPSGMAGIPDAIEQGQESVEEELAIALAERISEMESEYDAIMPEIRIAVNTGIGDVDNALEESEEEVDKLLNKYTISLHNEQGMNMYELRQSGVAVADDYGEMIADSDDESLDRYMMRLMGTSPATTNIGVQGNGGTSTYDGSNVVSSPGMGTGSINDDGRLDTPATGYNPGGSGSSGGLPILFPEPPSSPPFPPGDIATCVWDAKNSVFKCDDGSVPPSPPVSPEPPLVPPTPPESGDGSDIPTVPPTVDEPCDCHETPKDCRPLAGAVICWPSSSPPTSPPSPPTSPPPPPDSEVPPPTVPPPPMPEPPPPYPRPDKTILTQLNWGQPNACTRVESIIYDWTAEYERKLLENVAKGNLDPEANTLGALALTTWPMAFRVAKRGVEGLGLSSGSVDDEFGRKVAQAALSLTDFDELSKSPLINSISRHEDVKFVGQTIAIANKIEKDSGFPAQYLAKSAAYALQYLVPQGIPSQDENNRLFLTNQITSDHWTCWTRANGNIPEAFIPLLKSARTRPGVADAISLHRRGLITDSQLRDRLLENGVRQEDDQGAFYALSEFIPPYSDLIRMMVRDSADKSVVDAYGYDTDFEKKFAGPMRAWATAQGIPEDVFRFLWRAHWQLPSPTQLYEMLHRFRVDRPEVIEWDRLYGKLDERELPPGVPPRPVVIRPADIQKVLEANDMSPFWIPFQMGISYHPITRTDAIDAFHAGSFDQEELYHAMRDNGYDDANARRLVEIQVSKRGRRLANMSGVWTTRSIIRAYREGVIDYTRAEALLNTIIVDPRQRRELLLQSDDEVKATNGRQFLKRLKRGFFVGELTPEEATAQMVANGIAERRINDLIYQWIQDRDGRYREPTARQIIAWAALGIISMDDAYSRCIRLGYLDIDAQRIVYQGVDAWRNRVTAQAEKQEKKIRQFVKDKKTATREKTAELEKQQKEAEAQMKKLQQVQERIQKELDKRTKLENG